MLCGSLEEPSKINILRYLFLIQLIMHHNRINQLFNIQFPIIQAGMVWASGWKLASAVSNAGGLGLIGAGSMYPDILKEHIKKCKAATTKPFGVNIPLMYPDAATLIDLVIAEKVPIVFTSAGNPAIFTSKLQQQGIKVVHVVSSSKFAIKAQAAGCDAVVAEGFEAGGHNGREETTSLVLIPSVRSDISIPLIAAGGIASGKQMLAAMVLGADGVQVGSLFICTPEASSHIAFKEAIIKAEEGDTLLAMKQLMPVRLLKNDFFKQVAAAELAGADAETLKKILGRARAKLGMFEGDLSQGELEVGQVSAQIKEIKPAAQIVADMMLEYTQTLAGINRGTLN